MCPTVNLTYDGPLCTIKCYPLYKNVQNVFYAYKGFIFKWEGLGLHPAVYENQYGISECPAYPRLLYPRFIGTDSLVSATDTVAADVAAACDAAVKIDAQHQ